LFYEAKIVPLTILDLRMHQTLNTNADMQAYAPTSGLSNGASLKQYVPGHISRIHGEAQQPKTEDNKSAISGGFANKLLGVTFLLLVISIALYLAAAYFGDNISRGGHSASTETIEVVVGNDLLHVPANFIRHSNQRKAGLHHRLELYMHWPTLSGYSDELSHAFNTISEESDLIFVTLEKRSMPYDMSGRIAPIYKRFFTGQPTPYKAGLVKQSLNSEAGFIDEDLYYAAGSPYPFATRCVKDNSTVGTPYCIRDIHLSENLSLTYRFHKRMLTEWITLERKLRETVKNMLIKPIKG